MAREISLSKWLKIVEFVPSGPGSTRAFCRRMGVSLRSFHRIRSRWSGSGTSSLHPALNRSGFDGGGDDRKAH